MKNQLNLIATLLGGLLFNYLFWMEGLALNLLLYAVFLLITVIINENAIKDKKVIYFGASHFTAAILVVYLNTDLSIIAYYISLFVWMGFVHSPVLRSVLAALITMLIKLVSSPIILIMNIANLKIGKFSLKPILKPIKYIVIPSIAILFFSLLYSIANPIFEKYVVITFTSTAQFFENIFSFLFADLSFDRFMHIILGILFTGGLLLKLKMDWFNEKELSFKENLARVRTAKTKPSFIKEIVSFFFGSIIHKKMALKSENIIGIVSFAGLNLLLLALNSIDIATLWLGKTVNKVGINYSEELHAGTNVLIVSIFLAMFIIIYFFSGNLNFYRKNKAIRTLALIWIFQNAFLVLSVLLRDYHYIIMHGLTYKRIGVLVFLTLCTIGLTTVYQKVTQLKSLFYLFKTNSIVWYMMLIGLTFINWDVLIVNYNIKNRNSIDFDLDHTLSLSNRTLAIVDQNKAILQNYLPQSEYKYKAETALEADTNVTTAIVKQTQINLFEQDLQKRIDRFKSRQQNQTWLSWNYQDWRTLQYLNNKK